MKKSIVFAAYSMLFVVAMSCSRKMETKVANNKKNGSGAEKNKTEGYFYHQGDSNLSADSTKAKKNVNN